jgi:hypothetical protein
MRPTIFLALLPAAAVLSQGAAAQTPAPERRAERSVTIMRGPGNAFSFSTDGADRAFLGIMTGSGGKRDTLGLLIQSVTPNSPAEKGGLEEGQRLQSINGVNLKLDREDAGEPELSGMMQRRLSRELAKVKPGDEVTLGVWSTGGVKTMKVKTGSPDDMLSESARATKERISNRAILGIGMSGSASKRDTLGVFVSSVTEGGPAEKAGIAEGDRIASIDGTDLRVPHEDAGDYAISSARRNRIGKLLKDKKPGDEVSLRLYQGGRYRDLKVKLGKASDFGGEGGMFFFGDDGEGMGLRNFNFSMPRISIPRISVPRILRSGDDDEDGDPMPAMAPMAPMAPRAPMAASALRALAPLPPAAPRARLARGYVTI